MKKIKLIFLAITFFTLSVAHSQTDEVKRNLYEQEKIRIEKLEKDKKCPVFCLQVPSEVFYVRKNGKPVWTGNSRAQGHVTSLTRQPLEGPVLPKFCLKIFSTKNDFLQMKFLKYIISI